MGKQFEYSRRAWRGVVGGGRGGREALSLPLPPPPALARHIFGDSTGSGPSQCQDTGSYRTIEGHFLVSWSFTYICHQLSGLLGSAIVWRDCKRLGAPPEALGYRMHYCAELAAPPGVGRKVVGKKGRPDSHCHCDCTMGWEWGVGGRVLLMGA